MTDEKLKIGLLIPYLRDGGVERSMINLADGLIELGHSADLIVCAGGLDGPLAGEIPAGAGRVALGARSAYGASLRLAAYVNEKRPWALLAALTPANVVAVAAKYLVLPRRIQLRVGVGVQVSILPSYASSRGRARLRPMLYRQCYRRADRVIAVSDGVRDELLDIGLAPESVTTIFNPVVNSRTRALAAAPPDHEWFRRRDLPVVLAAGRLHPQKDFLTLLRAFRRVRAQRPCRLVILGEGDERPRLEAAIRELGIGNDVSLPGFVANPYCYMRAADLFVLSSAYEGFGNVVAEALCIGGNVVSTDCPSGPREILDNGRYGRLTPVGDVQVMAEAILSRLDAPPIPESAGCRAAFEARTVAAQYLAAFGAPAASSRLECALA